MKKIPFSEKELEVLGELPPEFEGLESTKIYNTPISNKENWKLLFREKHPVWVPGDIDNTFFSPTVIPDSGARALVVEAIPFDPDSQGGGPDMYGTEWVYQPQQMGSMVRPGVPRVADMNDWKEIVKRPDIDAWDWEASAKANREYLSVDRYICCQLLSGWFERLISLMDFAEAALALIDEDQQDAVHEFLDATSDDMCKIIDKICEYMPEVDGFVIHDDWAGQASPFFSQDTAMEMIVPHMRKVTDHIHAKGKFAELHSCGHGETRIEAIIAAGWDAWAPQPMNDVPALYEKYGNKIVLMLDPGVLPEDDEPTQREKARAFAHRFCKPGKVAIPGGELYINLPAFVEELYIETRKIFSES